METKKFFIILLSSVLAVFVGAFLSFWVLFGNINNNYHKVSNDSLIIPKVFATENTINDISDTNKVIEQQVKIFDKVNKDFEELMNIKPVPSSYMFIGKNRINNQSQTSIKTEELKDKYKITVDLKPFNNDEKNVDLKVKDNTISISANYQSKAKNEFNSSHFYQSLTLPEKLNIKEIKQEKKGSYLIITVPK